MRQRDQILLEQRQRIIKQSDKKFWVKFQRVINEDTLQFKIWIDCSSWNNSTLHVTDIINLINKLYPESTTVYNDDNYHLLVDDLYGRLATEYPDKNIWIELNNENFGLLAKYETHTPSTLLKI